MGFNSGFKGLMYFYTPLSLTDKVVTEGYKPRNVQEKMSSIVINISDCIFFCYFYIIH